MLAAELLALVSVCAPAIAPLTMLRLIEVESGGNPLAVHVNGRDAGTAKTRADALQIARQAIADGFTVDLGLVQINSRNLQKLNITLEQAFDPCLNLRAGATLLAANYARYRKSPQDGLRSGRWREQWAL